jgi:hypothetical protein
MEACATNCASSSAALTACISVADTSGCSQFVAPASCVDAGEASSVCFRPAGETFAQSFEAVAPLFCLAPVPDGGAHDGGNVDAGVDGGAVGPSDAGDGGD